MTQADRWAILLVSCGLWGCSGEEAEPKPGAQDITLPDPGPNGFQITTGPFEVAQGMEVQDCYFFEVASDVPVFVNRITLAQNSGTHHMNIFRVRTVQQLDGNPGEVVRGGECWKSANWADWPLVANSQTGGGVEDWDLPEGVALRLEPHEKLMLQTHYVNARTQVTPERGKVVANFYGVPQSEVQNELGTLFATNQSIRVCPGDVNKTFEASCKFGQAQEVTVIGANGHFHSRGQRFTINEFDELSGKGQQFYESTQWDDPPFLKDLSVKIPSGGGISWACEFSAANDACGDKDDDCCFTFGGYVEYQEHCNAFLYYYPRGNTDINCF